MLAAVLAPRGGASNAVQALKGTVIFIQFRPDSQPTRAALWVRSERTLIIIPRQRASSACVEQACWTTTGVAR
jgi:hypothetical protein